MTRRRCGGKTLRKRRMTGRASPRPAARKAACAGDARGPDVRRPRRGCDARVPHADLAYNRRMVAAPTLLATAADLARSPDDVRAEVISGVLVEKAAPSPDHAYAQTSLVGQLWEPLQRRGGDRPVGWWILVEVEVELQAHEVYRPDIAGWRRDRCPQRPRERPVTARPDWVCEVLSPSNASNDLVRKLRVYHRCGIPHYWIVDPDREILTVHRFMPDGYLTALVATKADRVRAEPFEAIELRVGALFGEEDDDA